MSCHESVVVALGAKAAVFQRGTGLAFADEVVQVATLPGAQDVVDHGHENVFESSLEVNGQNTQRLQRKRRQLRQQVTFGILKRGNEKDSEDEAGGSVSSGVLGL